MQVHQRPAVNDLVGASHHLGCSALTSDNPDVPVSQQVDLSATLEGDPDTVLALQWFHTGDVGTHGGLETVYQGGKVLGRLRQVGGQLLPWLRCLPQPLLRRSGQPVIQVPGQQRTLILRHPHHPELLGALGQQGLEVLPLSGGPEDVLLDGGKVAATLALGRWLVLRSLSYSLGGSCRTGGWLWRWRRCSRLRCCGRLLRRRRLVLCLLGLHLPQQSLTAL